MEIYDGYLLYVDIEKFFSILFINIKYNRYFYFQCKKLKYYLIWIIAYCEYYYLLP